MMILVIFKYLRDFLNELSPRDTLDSYISSHTPQNAGDVERLEREYMAKRAVRWYY